MKLFISFIQNEIYVIRNAKYIRRFIGAKHCEDIFGREYMRQFLSDYSFCNGDLQWSDKNIRKSWK